MKNFLLMLAAVSSLFFNSCTTEPELKSGDAELLLGSWINPDYSDSIYSFTRAAVLKENDYGITFKSNNKLVERKNAGWCGTPPIAYSDFTGTWSLSNSTIHISSKFWGGIAHYQWRIISINNNKLVIERIKEDYSYDE